jgi:cytidyltransferase-like protein
VHDDCFSKIKGIILVKRLNEMAFSGESITIFDLDDTLVVTNARIAVKDSKTGEVFHLTPQEFNEYEHKPHHEVNYSQFEDPQILKAGKLVEDILTILKDTYENSTAVGIVTARNKGSMIREFFLDNGIDIHPKFVIAVNDPAEGFHGTVAEKKQQAFRRLYEMGYTDFKFFDDDINNLTLAKELEKELPITVNTHRVTANHLPKLGLKEIGIFTGKFKPPHTGHYDMIKQYAEQNDEFHVFVSSKTEGEVTGQMAVSILELYFAGDSNIQIHLSDVTPVRSAYEWVEALGKTQDAPNNKINLYALPADMKRFAAMEKWLGGITQLQRIETVRPEFIKGTGQEEGDSDGVSGTLMRQFIVDDLESFAKGLPNGVDKDRVWAIVKGGQVEENGTFAVPADSFNQATDLNIMPTDINVPVGGLPSHWTTSQPYSRFDLKTNPMADRYGSNPGGRAVKTFDDFCQEEPETATFNKSAENNKLNK